MIDCPPFLCSMYKSFTLLPKVAFLSSIKVISLENVVTPATLTLSKFVCPSTSMSWKVAIPT